LIKNGTVLEKMLLLKEFLTEDNFDENGKPI
jgi:hypothetical protein